tara:strand:- start:179 stop:1876 length:1698 start_codon:yes stop_codon:yes gene_type:complete
MESRNLILAISLSALVIILYSIFFVEPDPNQIKKDPVEKTKTVESFETPKIEQQEKIEKLSRQDAIASSERIYFENEFIKGSIALTNGGAVDDYSFKTYNKSLGSKEKIILLNPGNVENGYLFNTGWATNSDVETPNSKTVWKIDGNSKLTPTSPVKIYFENSQGIRFERKISLDKKYLFNIDQKIINNSNNSYKFYPYAFLHRNNVPKDLTKFWILHEGYISYTDGELDELKYDEIKKKKYTKEASSGYVAIGDGYFLTSLIPNQERKFRIDISYKRKYRASYIDLEGFEVDPNSSIKNNIKSIIGAKEIALLDNYENELGVEKLSLIINYGMLFLIVRPLWIVLDYLFKFSGNYGYAIILLTIAVRIFFFPLNQYAMGSMAKMKHLAKPMADLKSKYKDDKQQLNREMMKLYKENGVNPAASCLPILIQIPIFFSLYKLLMIDIAMRHAPFMWIWEDLSAKDPTSIFNLFGLLNFSVPSFLEIGVLPVLMGGSMFLTQKMNPAPVGNDPAQEMMKKMFKWFPVFITVLLAPFASGLVLYWTTTNLATALQQWYLNKKVTVKKN